jgi:hypothetical protein
VLLMDSIVATGNVVNMAIHVLLDHGVAEHNICVVCVMASHAGMMSVCTAFPRIKLVAACVELLDKRMSVSGDDLSELSKRFTRVTAQQLPVDDDDDENVTTPRRGD